MKVYRLIGIISVLRQKKRVTAPELAKRFEVSRRTIHRDIEDICKAGIPLVTTQGKNGGISIMDGYLLDDDVFSVNELERIFAGLAALDSVSHKSATQIIEQKLSGGKDTIRRGNITIDLASFYKTDTADKIETIEKAITEHNYVSFNYCSKTSESHKTIEPYGIIYKWSSWYLFGYSTEHNDFRLYKFRRMYGLSMTDASFTPREIPDGAREFGAFMTDDYYITAVFDNSVKYRLLEEYGENSYLPAEDGKLYAKIGFTNTDDAISFFLGLGSKVTVLDPPEFVEKLRAEINKINNLYMTH